MKTIFLIRHAKAEAESPSNKDIDRPLKPKGIAEAKLVGKYLKENNISPDLIISSPAARAFSTSKIVAKTLSYTVDNIRLEEILFYKDVPEILDILSSIENRYNTIFLIGHNPVISNLGNYLLQQPFLSFHTAGIACIELPVEKWNEIQIKGTLKFYLDPSVLS